MSLGPYCEVERVHTEPRFANGTVAVFVLGRPPSGGPIHLLRGDIWIALEENLASLELAPTFEFPESGLEVLAAAIDKIRARPPLDAIALEDAKQVRDRALGIVERTFEYFIAPPPEPITTERIRSV